MAIITTVMIAPLVWMGLTSLKPDTEIVAYPPRILPRAYTLRNYENLFTVSDFAVYLRNSVLVATVTTVAPCCAG